MKGNNYIREHYVISVEVTKQYKVICNYFGHVYNIKHLVLCQSYKVKTHLERIFSDIICHLQCFSQTLNGTCEPLANQQHLYSMQLQNTYFIKIEILKTATITSR